MAAADKPPVHKILSHVPTHTNTYIESAQRREFKLYWEKSEGRKEIEFGDVLFAVTDAKTYHCQFGNKYYKKGTVKGKRLWLQGSHKVGCGAYVEVKYYILYTEYTISDAAKSIGSNCPGISGRVPDL